MRAMFHTVAPRYDFITRAFSYGMDRHWKRTLLDRAPLPQKPLILDLASGTGDFAGLAARRLPGARAVAVDITERMLRLACDRGVRWAVCADASRLPFRDGVFDGVCVGYGMRNFPDLGRALSEIRRVTRPGGALATLDFFLPANAFLRRFYLAYLYAQGAFWGLLLHARPRVYTYIPDSLKSFLDIEGFSAALGSAGFHRVESRGFVLGGIGLHWAVRK